MREGRKSFAPRKIIISVRLRTRRSAQPSFLLSAEWKISIPARDDNGSAGHGSRVKWVNKSEWFTWVTVRVSTRDPLTHDQVNKIPKQASISSICTANGHAV